MTTVDFIQSIIDGLTFTEKITNMVVDPVLNETQFETCLTHHVFENYKITIDGTEYIVKDLEHNMWITVKGQVPGTPLQWSCPAPFYFHGTPLQVGSSLRMEKQWRKKLPFWYLLEPFTEQRNDDPLEKIEKLPMITMYILFPIGPDDKSVDDHYENKILPAENAIEDFRRKLRHHPNIAKIKELYSFTTKTRVNFGVWVTKPGQSRKKANEDNIQLMFDEYVSGIEINFRIPLKRPNCTAYDKCK